MGLDDAILIKENHVALAGRPATRAVELAAAAQPGARGRGRVPRPASEVDEALAAGADRLLLDNMEPGRAARRRSRPATPPGSTRRLEASGGVTLDNVAEVAATGVDLISIGALTHSAPALDLSMLLEPATAG